MALFNAFLNSKQSGGRITPWSRGARPRARRAPPAPDDHRPGIRRPADVWGGKVHGSVYMDFFAGANKLRCACAPRPSQIDLEDPQHHGRPGETDLQSARAEFPGAGGDLAADRHRQSLAVAAAGAGRAGFAVQRDYRDARADGRNADARNRSVCRGPSMPEAARPRLEGRFEFYHGSTRTAPRNRAGFHTSTTHAAGFSIPSNLFSLDWFFNPWKRWSSPARFTPGRTSRTWAAARARASPCIRLLEGPTAVNSIGGWGQMTVHAAPRLDLHLFTGQQDDANHRPEPGASARICCTAATSISAWRRTLLLGLEATQVRTDVHRAGMRINNHYDLALAYLF